MSKSIRTAWLSDVVDLIDEPDTNRIVCHGKEFVLVKHGHWLFYEEPDGYYHSECSECGQWCNEDVFLKGKWHYCPNCGCKMDEVENADT